MGELQKEIKSEEKMLSKFLSKRENVWMSVAIIVSVLLLISLIINFSGGISKTAAGNKLVNFLNTEVVQGGGVTLKSVVSNGSLYLVTVIYNGQEIPVYTTKDGGYFIQSAIPITSSSPTTGQAVVDTPQDIPKTDKPKLDLYVFTYCPYGTQSEKGLVPVYNLMKNKADINVVFIGAMHGEFERQESLRQLCIQKIYGKDKLFAYLDKFNTNSAVGSCGGTDSCVLPLIKTIYSSLSISSTAVDSCMVKDAPALYAADEAKAQSLGIGGSPTFVVNGVQVQSGRDSASILKTLCSAFNNQPSECSQTLSSASPSAGFGGSTGASSGASCG